MPNPGGPAPSIGEWRGGYADVWAMPRWAWVLPWVWWRLYLHVADALLFRLWWWSRPLLWRLEDVALLEADRAHSAPIAGGRNRCPNITQGES
jgi:hypothetical protein